MNEIKWQISYRLQITGLVMREMSREGEKLELKKLHSLQLKWYLQWPK